MSDARIKKRITVTAGGTPEYVGNLMKFRLPEEIPSDAVIVDVQIRTDTTRSITSATDEIWSSHLTFTLEWPA